MFKIMTENWDRFEPFNQIEKKDFSFHPSRFEVWSKGQMIGNGNSFVPLIGSVREKNGSSLMAISYNETALFDEILEEVFFDEFISSTDRLKLVTIPTETYTENMGLLTLRITYGPTRLKKDFHPKEPYCCNLFYQNGLISKISFSFSFPEKLIELYI
jgi:hypothetical protein